MTAFRREAVALSRPRLAQVERLSWSENLE